MVSPVTTHMSNGNEIIHNRVKKVVYKCRIKHCGYVLCWLCSLFPLSFVSRVTLEFRRMGGLVSFQLQSTFAIEEYRAEALC
jgi:hypothetical protein